MTQLLEQTSSSDITYRSSLFEHIEITEVPHDFTREEKLNHPLLKLVQCGRRKDETTLVAELKTALSLTEQLKRPLEGLYGALLDGHKVSIEVLSELLKALVSSVLRNPHALPLAVSVQANDDHEYSRFVTQALTTLALSLRLGVLLRLSETKLHSIALAVLMTALLQKVGDDEVKANTALKYTLYLLRQLGNVDVREINLIMAQAALKLDILKLDILKLDILKSNLSNGHQRMSKPLPFEGEVTTDVATISLYYRWLLENRLSGARSSTSRAVCIIALLKGDYFSHELVDSFVNTIGMYEVGSLVKLNSGQVALILANNTDSLLTPQVMTLPDLGAPSKQDAAIVDLYAGRKSGAHICKCLKTTVVGQGVISMLINALGDDNVVLPR